MGELYRLDFPNGKSYIGITTLTAKKRFHGHSGAFREGKDNLLYRAWAKYGPPVMKLLAVLENEDLFLAEIKAIKVFNTTTPNGYNLLEGGQFPPMIIPEIAKKSGLSRRGRKRSEESIEKTASANRGRIVPEETKRKISFSLIGNKRSAGRVLTKEEKTHLSQIWKGVPKSEKTKLSMSKSQTGRLVSEETRNKIRHTNTGKKHTEDTRMKMRISQKLRREKEKQNG